MKGDFTRLTFRPTNHYSSVRLQQGRVQLDADWNEQIDIQVHRDETTTQDTVGLCGAPLHNAGFAVTPQGGNLLLGAGRYYVDGILSENEQVVTIAAQPPLAEIASQPDLPGATLPTQPGIYVAYIDVWQRHLTAVEKPAIREVALGGPDTASRTKTVWQVKLQRVGELPDDDSVTCSQFGDSWVPNGAQSTGQLRAREEQEVLPDTLCGVLQGGGFRRLENQLYRVEIHDEGQPYGAPRAPETITTIQNILNPTQVQVANDGRLWQAGQFVELFRDGVNTPGTLVRIAAVDGSGLVLTLEQDISGIAPPPNRLRRIATFKWSRDNGSIVTALQDIREDDITVSDPGKDAVLAFTAGQWVELSDEGRTLHGAPGILIELAAVQGNVLTVSTWPNDTRLTLNDFGDLPTVRRWDSEGTGAVTVGTFVELEDGVQVQFEAGAYRTGDYWLIPARTLSGKVEWPQDETSDPVEPRFEPPHGIVHHYCALALLRLDDTGWTPKSDCRRHFPPLTELSPLQYVGGSGQEAMPDLTLSPATLVPLNQPLQVGVANRVGAIVRFRITQGNGQLQNTATSVEILTGEDGIATCTWALDSATQSQQVEAHLLDGANGQAVSLPVRFNANLSVASQVAYLPPAGCANLQDQRTVQAVIDQLARLPRFFYVGGDGQEAMPTFPLPQLLQVGVANTCGPVVGARVQFATTGNGRVAPDIAALPTATSNTIEILTDANGIASCAWRLENNPTRPSQQLTATLLGGASVPAPAPIRFTANLSLASQVAYDPRACPNLTEAGVGTVQEAIDQLCQIRDRDPGMHVREVLLQSGQRLVNDTDVLVAALAPGIRVVCDRQVDPEILRGKPVGFVTLDMPFPFNRSDIEMWGPPVIGFQPLILAADLSFEGDSMVWRPTTATQQWLLQRLFQMMAQLQRGNRVLAHLTLKGNFIWSGETPPLYLDGEAFGIRQPGQTNTDLDLRQGSGDGRRGGDFEMWFWLVPALIPGPGDRTVEPTEDQRVTDGQAGLTPEEGPPAGAPTPARRRRKS